MFKFLEKHHNISILITLAIIIFIFVMSSLPAEKISVGIGIPILTWETLIYHFIIFFLLSFFLNISIIRGKSGRKIFILLVAAVVVLYGISDELHQFFVPGRFCTLTDVLVDSAGSLLASLIYWLRFR